MRLHLIGLFHTIPRPDFSHCAFTGRVIRFGKMMLPFGYEVIEYSNEGATTMASEHVVILKTEEFKRLKDLYYKEHPNDAANMDSTIYREFSKKLDDELLKRVKPGDIICHPFGLAHSYLGEKIPHARHVEIGIGYEQAFFPLRVYETHTWWSWHQGKEYKAGNSYQWVCPMGYDINEWEPKYEQGEYILYFGRVMSLKGLDTVKEIAKHLPDRQVIICGGGDPSPWLDTDIPNLVYKPPVLGLARSDLLRNAYCMLMPTVYSEPFGGSGIESMLCGTPLISSDHGCFSENVQHGVNGFRCKTLGDWLHAIRKVETLDRRKISDLARSKYNLTTVGKQMDKIFRQIKDLDNKGWYTLEPTDAIWTGD
jgi:glycosyltransferase involved in cell wall biosynthesis